MNGEWLAVSGERDNDHPEKTVQTIPQESNEEMKQPIKEISIDLTVRKEEIQESIEQKKETQERLSSS